LAGETEVLGENLPQLSYTFDFEVLKTCAKFSIFGRFLSSGI
jgi:hypothetical protein